MAATMKELGLEKLSHAERLALASELWDSVRTATAAPLLSEAHCADLEQRLEEYQDDPGAGSPWEEVKARLLKGQT